MAEAKRIRCAIYTRKSSDEGLEQEFNSLDAQHEACAAFIASQKHEGWRLISKRYDDGGISGGTLERPGLTALLADIEAGRIDQIVVYKIDRLTRSLSDFSRIVDRLEAKGASFVSVTQSFNTATSMGRLTLNMLLSFAQFEREVTAERIRDKIAASKKKGLWMGGLAPMGYDPNPDKTIRGLVINAPEAETVRRLFALYAQHGNLSKTRQAAQAEGLRSKKRVYADGTTTGDQPLSNGQIHHMLTNPIYIGKIRHKDALYEGQHAALIDQALWDAVQQTLQHAAMRKRGAKAGGDQRAWLTGRIFDETGDRLTPSHSKKVGRVLRYYLSNRLITKGKDPIGWRLPAPQIEGAIAEAVRDHLRREANAGTIVRAEDVDELRRLSSAAEVLITGLEKVASPKQIAPLIERVDLSKERVRIALSSAALARALSTTEDRLCPEACSIDTALHIRRRGVEQKMLIGDRSAGPDPKLQELLARAHHWLGAIKAGISLADLARTEKTSTSYIRTRLPLAFLAPDIQRRIIAGDHPPHWCVEYFRKAKIPTCWEEQRKALLTSQ